MISLTLSDPYFSKKSLALQALYAVIDPELNINIIDLGLVYDIMFDENTVTVIMTLSTPHCPMGETICNGVKNSLENVFPEHSIIVNLTWQPQWDFDMISEEGKKTLGYSSE